MIISFIGERCLFPQVGESVPAHARASTAATLLSVDSDMLWLKRVDQLLVHAVGGAQMEFVLRVVEHVDRAGVGVGKLHRLGDDGGKHILQVERRVHRL